MKKKSIALASVLCIMIAIVLGKQYVDAHPGPTDSSGCHTCRTNCAKWGLSQGEYHCHNGGGSSSRPSSSNSTTTKPATPKATAPTPTIDYAAKGKAEGYAFKNENPDVVLPSLAGQNDAYVTAYKESFNQACVELTLSSEKLAVENATRDATTTEAANTNSEGLKVIKEVYVEKYNDTYEQIETDMFIEIEKTAKEKAKEDALNLKESTSTTDSYTLQKTKKYYQEQYTNTYESQKKLVKELEEEIKKEAISLGKEKAEKEYSIIEGYKSYEVYNSLKSVFDKAYEEGVKEGEDNTIFGVIGLAVIAGGGIVYYRKRKIKKQNV